MYIYISIYIYIYIYIYRFIHISTNIYLPCPLGGDGSSMNADGTHTLQPGPEEGSVEDGCSRARPPGRWQE